MSPSSSHVYRAPSKKLKAYGSHVDHISKLPDCVVSHILSCLPTEDAVRTSILSRNWEHKWTSIYNIDIDEYKYTSLRGKDKVICFPRIVDQTLQLTGGSRLRSFRLSCSHEYYPKYFETWIRAVLKRNVQNLRIKTHPFQCPLSANCFYGWTSLTELKLLKMCCSLNVSATTCFVNLKSLYLASDVTHGIRIKNDQSPNTSRIILLTFPVLEVLELSNCKWLDVDYVEIQAPELVRFETQSLFGPISDYEIKIHGPKLDKYESHEGRIDNFVVIAPAVTHTYLGHSKSDNLALRASMILKGFQNLKCLKLWGETVEALVQSKSLIMFSTVKRLELCSKYSPNRDVIELLRALPSLESLEVEMWRTEEQVGESLPLCIMSNLKDVKFTSFKGSTRELDFAEAILTNAKNLEKVFVSVDRKLNKMTRLLSKLMPSSNCTLHVEKGIPLFRLM